MSSDPEKMSPKEAVEYLAAKGLTLRRQRVQQLCEPTPEYPEPVLESEMVEVTILQRQITKASLDRLLRDGLPKRAGRPRKVDPEK